MQGSTVRYVAAGFCIAASVSYYVGRIASGGSIDMESSWRDIRAGTGDLTDYVDMTGLIPAVGGAALLLIPLLRRNDYERVA